MEILISVVIPNYNGLKLLEKNLPDLKRSLSGYSHEIIISDDASTDGSCEFIKSFYPEIILISNFENKGFSKNINQAIQLATGKFVLAINTDISVTQNFIQPLIDAMSDNHVFASASTLTDSTGKILDAIKIPKISASGLKTTIDFFSNDFAKLKAVPTLFGSAACCLYRRNYLEQLYGFDEIYSPFYYEDADLCLRASSKNWTTVWVPQSSCFHVNSATIKAENTKKRIRKIAYRNKIILNFRFLPYPWLILFIIMSIFKALIAWFYRPWYYQSWIEFIKINLNSKVKIRCNAIEIENVINRIKFIHSFLKH